MCKLPEKPLELAVNGWSALHKIFAIVPRVKSKLLVKSWMKPTEPQLLASTITLKLIMSNWWTRTTKLLQLQCKAVWQSFDIKWKVWKCTHTFCDRCNFDCLSLSYRCHTKNGSFRKIRQNFDKTHLINWALNQQVLINGWMIGTEQKLNHSEPSNR